LVDILVIHRNWRAGCYMARQSEADRRQARA
jgi:hypothetical protein